MDRISFSTGALYPLETTEAFTLLHEAGFAHAELMPQAFRDVEQASVKGYVASGIHVASIHYPLAMFAMLYSAQRSMSEEGRELSLKIVNLAHAMDSGVIVIHPTEPYVGEMAFFDERVKDNIRYLGGLCEKEHITLAMENHPTGVGQHPGTLEAYIRSWNMPAMHPMVDTTEVCEGGEDPVRFIADLQETPCHLHLSDFANGTKHLPVGKGSLDWKQIFSVLGKRQYQGYYTLEPSYRYYLTDIKAKLASARESMSQWI